MGNISQFPNIDFTFRVGYKESYKKSKYIEGSLNFLKDTRELYVEKDGLRFSISAIIFDAGTENQIRAIVQPENKIYLASDTMRLLFFNQKELRWIIVGGDHVSLADLATVAEYDTNHNKIADYYYSKADALISHENISNQIKGLLESVGGIIEFDTQIFTDISELPVVGEKGIIYLIPSSSYYGMTIDEYSEDDATIIDNHYIELLWAEDPSFGGYYEIIGNTSVNLSNYFIKEEVLNIVSQAKEDILNQMSQDKSDLLAMINSDLPASFL